MTTRDEEDLFTQHVLVFSQQTQHLFNQVRETPWRQPELIIQCLEQLQVTVEELHVADEALQEQHQALLVAQEALEQERQRYRDLFDFAPDGYVITDCYGVVEEANRAAGHLLNIRPDRLVGKPFSNFVEESQRRAFRALVNQLPQIRRVQDWQTQLHRREQGTFDASLTTEVVHDDQGQAIAIRWLIRDITSSKQAEEQLRQMYLQNLELREMDHLKNQFISSLSHELITPLSAILGFSDLLLQHFHKQQDFRFAEITKRILQSGRNLLDVIEDMLSNSRLKSYRMTLNPEPFDITVLLRTTAEELRSLADQKALQLRIYLPDEALVVSNDPIRLRQVTVNLLSNAIKFTDVGIVSLHLWELPEGRLAIGVSDTGIGIDPEEQSHIFQEFWRASAPRVRQQRGAGLGLAITKAIVELMQGTIGVESRPGEGSVFRVEIPRWISADILE